MKTATAKEIEMMKEAFAIGWKRFDDTHVVNKKYFQKVRKAYFYGFKDAIELVESKLWESTNEAK